MKAQNSEHPLRFVKLYPQFGPPLLLVLLIGSVINLVTSSKENLYSASLILVTNILLGITLYFARAFALKANDRAIRAEENFRHYIISGTPLPAGLRLGQIVALRFASDAELVALAAKAKSENLGSNAIKEQIQNWRADHERV